MKNFTWLHLSDLHAGMTGHDWLWPNVKASFYDDLKRLHAKVGSWDAVIFSGDLTQSGKPEEFEKVTAAIKEIWAIQADLGFRPVLVVVPGNHDLVRPDSSDPTALVLKDWWNQEIARSKMFSAESGPYGKLIASNFSNYSTWIDGLEAAGIPLLSFAKGKFPGDVSGTLPTPIGPVGIIGLNSSWLQIDGGDFEGRLSVDPRQLLSVTEDNPSEWCGKHQANLIVTHHPVSWLHPISRDLWRSEINLSGRFNAHLFGHMHEPDTTTTSHGGSPSRTSIQAASIFGLEKFSDQKIARTHGYSIGRIEQDGCLRVWPRIAMKLASGELKLVPDHKLGLDDDGSFSLGPGTSGANISVSAPTQDFAVHTPSKSGLEFSAVGDRVLESIRYYISNRGAHTRVRKVEQRRALLALERDRRIWLAADWGSGSDGFLKSLYDALGLENPEAYKLDLTDYVSRSDFLDTFKSKIGVGLEQLCGTLAERKGAFLILDNAPTTTSPMEPGRIPVETDLDSVIDAVLNFCPDLRVVVRSRRTPIHHSKDLVVLGPLDEADLRTYVFDHERGGPEFMKPDSISAIYRHSDGIPGRVDSTLRDLEIIPLDRLSSTNSDLVRIPTVQDDVPIALRNSVLQISESTEPERQRAFDLLKALSAFPQGETLERLRRFYGAKGLFPSNARELLDNSLIVTSTPAGGQVSAPGSSEKLLKVPRVVREIVQSITTSEDQQGITQLAASLYFGDQWQSGTLRQSVSAKFSNPTVQSYEILNANAIILRLLNDAIEIGDNRQIDAAVAVSKSYLVALFDGDHYRNVVSLSRDILTLLPEGREDSRAFLTYELGRALRMTGENRDARDMLKSVDQAHLPSSMKQGLLTSLALAHQRIGESGDAVECAKKIIKVDKNSGLALQAQAILLEEDDASTPEQLRTLERVCRKRGTHIVANNLALKRADQYGVSADEVYSVVEDVMKNSNAKDDFYNNARAIIKKIMVANKNGKDISDNDKSLLIDAYHYLYSERLGTLFDRCHSALWDLFARQNEQENLLRLFRHSSLIWRLRGDDSQEGEYLKKLALHVHQIVTRDFSMVNKETAYYLVRASAVLN